LGISRFSVMAHSAGAIYALATALRMPQHIRGRIHLLAPWIPPSQMTAIGIQKDQVPNTSLPYSQRLLRSLPTTFLKAANSSFFAMTSSSLASAMPSKTARRSKRRSTNDVESPREAKGDRRSKRNSLPLATSPTSPEALSKNQNQNTDLNHLPPTPEALLTREAERESEYELRLIQAIWDAATTHANPAVDLLVCLERRQEIGFRYADINKEVVIHHGSRDSRVPVENVEWLGNRMRRCEVRVLEGEGHGLMASAKVMSDVLGEIAQEWENWNAIINKKSR
jgi:pimeloyl-ACP methyl ester carboxylesterase